MKFAMSYSAEIDSVLDRMVVLKQTCCSPRVIMTADGKLLPSEGSVWSSEEAEAAFIILTYRLKRLVEEQQKLLDQENTQ